MSGGVTHYAPNGRVTLCGIGTQTDNDLVMTADHWTSATCPDCRLIGKLGCDGYLRSLSQDVKCARLQVDEAMANLARLIDRFRFAVESIRTERRGLPLQSAWGTGDDGDDEPGAE